MPHLAAILRRVDTTNGTNVVGSWMRATLAFHDSEAVIIPL